MKLAFSPRLRAATLALCCAPMAAVLGLSQEIQFDTPRPAAASRAQRVSLDTERLIVAAGKPDWIELTFQVQPGFHINSHAPHDETLIPTSVKIAASPRIQVLKDSYPAGLPLHLNVGAGETLSTYAGEFHVRLQVVADKGEQPLSGTLHYQACDTASCYPPRDLPFTVTLAAR